MGTRTRDVGSGSGNFQSAEQVISYKSIPNQVFGGLIPGMTGSSRDYTGRSVSPRPIGQDIKIKTSTG